MTTTQRKRHRANGALAMLIVMFIIAQKVGEWNEGKTQVSPQTQ